LLKVDRTSEGGPEILIGKGTPPPQKTRSNSEVLIGGTKTTGYKSKFFKNTNENK